MDRREVEYRLRAAMQTRVEAVAELHPQNLIHDQLELDRIWLERERNAQWQM